MKILKRNEHNSGFMKRLLIGLLVFLLGGYPSLAFALPNGGNVVGGSGTIGGTNPNMVINQNSDKLIINWGDFSIGSSESVQFIQPGTSSIALNRVIGENPSNILGTLSGNGQIWLVNPNGVFFGSNAIVDAHGIFVSTLDISDQDFLDSNNQYTFSQSGESLTSIINEGLIDVDDYAVLLAPTVINKGTILANLGHVALVSSTATTVDFTGDGLINFIFNEGSSGEVTNAGLIQANGGQVLLSAKDAGGVIRSVVNNTGVIEANTVVEKEGKIILSGGEGGLVKSSGKLSASGDDEGEKAGTIEIYGEDVELLASDYAESGNDELFQFQITDAIDEPNGETVGETNVNGEDGSGQLIVEATKSILVDQKIETTGEVEMTAANGIKVGQDLTAGGTINLNSDSDRDGEGLLDLSGAIDEDGQEQFDFEEVTEEVTIKTTGSESDINIIAADMRFDALNSSGDITFTDSYTDPEGEYEGIGIHGKDLAKITTNDLTINTEGSIMVASVTAEDTEDIKGTTTLNADSVVFGKFIYDREYDHYYDEDYDFSSTFANGLSVNAVNGILINANLTSLNGGMSFNADHNNDGFGTFGIYGVDVVSTDQLISITAADFEMASGLDAGEGKVNIRASAGRSIEINGDEERYEEEWFPADQIYAKELTGLVDTPLLGEGSEVMEISGYELGNITAKNITLRSGGNITVDGGENGIQTNSTVFFDAGKGLSFYGDFAADDSGRSVFFAGDGDFFVEEGGSVSTGNNLMLIKANDIDLQGSLYGAGIVVRASTGRTIGIDGNAESYEKSTICGEECGMTISQSEIDNMHSQFDDGEEILPRGIEFGNSRAGALTVDDINLNDNLFALVSGSTINDFDDGAPNIITSWGLVLRAGADIGNLGGPEGLNVDAGFVRFSNGADDNFTATNLNSSGDDTFFGAVTEGTGNISYTLGNGNLLVDLVSTQGDVNLEATTGSILDGNDVDGADNPGYLNVKADTATLTALSGIGEEGNRIETDVNTLNASTTGPGSHIYMHENDAIFLNNVNTPGTFDLLAGGAITEGTVNADLIVYNGAEQSIITPEQEEDLDQGTTSTFLTEFFENVADNSGC